MEDGEAEDAPRQGGFLNDYKVRPRVSRVIWKVLEHVRFLAIRLISTDQPTKQTLSAHVSGRVLGSEQMRTYS